MSILASLLSLWIKVSKEFEVERPMLSEHALNAGLNPTFLITKPIFRIPQGKGTQWMAQVHQASVDGLDWVRW